MFSFTDQHIRFATGTDADTLMELINKSYRGEESKKGWTTEALLIEGDTRADKTMIRETLERPGSVFLVYQNPNGKLAACVNLQKINERIYLGMFSVSPELQGQGIGKSILSASESFAAHMNCRSVYMSVISLRTELIDWYKRHGYSDTGERIPFTEDSITGKHKCKLEFMVLEKPV